MILDHLRLDHLQRVSLDGGNVVEVRAAGVLVVQGGEVLQVPGKEVLVGDGRLRQPVGQLVLIPGKPWALFRGKRGDGWRRAEDDIGVMGLAQVREVDCTHGLDQHGHHCAGLMIKKVAIRLEQPPMNFLVRSRGWQVQRQ